MGRSTKIALIFVATSVAISGCATKRYGRLTELSPAESANYTCREVDIEIAKVEQFRTQIAEGAKVDWRSVAGFLGDYGIGNAMEKSDAERSAARRMTDLQKVKAEKNCSAQTGGVSGIVRFVEDLFN